MGAQLRAPLKPLIHNITMIMMFAPNSLFRQKEGTQEEEEEEEEEAGRSKKGNINRNSDSRCGENMDGGVGF